jgi:heptosyltransferase I
LSSAPSSPAGSQEASFLVIKPSSLGDVIHTLPAVALLKRHHPKSFLRWLINPEWAPLLDGNPDIDQIVLFPRGEFRGLRGWSRLLPWVGSLKAYRSGQVLDFQGLLRSALIGRFCRPGRFIGLSDAREGARFFYDQVADVRHHSHAVDRYLELVYSLGIPRESTPLSWPLPAGNPLPAISPGFVLLHPFSRGTGKSLSQAQVIEFCQAIAPRRVILAGRSAELIPAQPNLTDLLNQTSLSELIWLIRQADFVVSVDSGPMHIASALTPRLLSLHTWSDPEKVGPYRREAWIWKEDRVFHRGQAPASGQVLSGMTQIAQFVAEKASSAAFPAFQSPF